MCGHTQCRTKLKDSHRQIPQNRDEPIHRIISRVAESPQWRKNFPEKRIFGTLEPSEYHDILSALTNDFALWQTTYFHRMPSIESIVEGYRATGLRPYLAALTADDGEKFTAEIAAALAREYPRQKNGEIIFRFPRLFFLAKNRSAK